MSGKSARFFLLFSLFLGLLVFTIRATLADVTTNLSVSATVPANSNDFPVTLTQNTSGSTFPQDTEISYTITYGSDLQGTTDLRLVASWSRGTISGDSSPSVDIIDYDPGSASNAYGATSPVIDTSARTITWTMSSFPASTTNETVTFKLKTNHSFTGSQAVNFDVSAQSHGSSADSATSTISKQYQYDASLNPTSTPTSTSTPTPTGSSIGPSATPGPTATAAQTFRFVNIALETVSPTSAGVKIQTTQDSTLSLSYGTQLNALSENIIDLSALKTHLLNLSNLKENTRYYFRVTALNREGNLITSDIYTFITGKKGEIPVIDNQRTIITSEHILIYPSEDHVFVLPRSMNYELNLVFSDPSFIKRVALTVRDPNVLGISTVSPPAVANIAGGDMKEIAPGRYVVRLATPNLIGRHIIVVRVSDSNGNITDQTLGTLRVVDYLTVLSKNTGKPIEHARVRLSLMDYRTGTYQFISPNVLPIPNPSFSEPDGIVKLVLPQGKYRADISTILDKGRSVDFTIGSEDGQNFPVVYLEREPFSIVSFTRYQWETCLDLFAAFKELFARFALSLRLFELNAYVVLTLFVVLTLVSFSKKIRIPLKSFGDHFVRKLKDGYFSERPQKRIRGIVTTRHVNTPIANADVFLVAPWSNAVVAHTKTNADGRFMFALYDTHSYSIEIIRDGLVPQRFSESTLEETQGGYSILIDSAAVSTHIAKNIVNTVLAVGFETLLVLSLLLEVVFVVVFGLTSTAPFIFLSLCNLFLLVIHTSQRSD